MPASTERPISLCHALALCGLQGRGILAGYLLLVVLQGTLPLCGLYAMQWLIDAVVAGARPGSDAALVWDAVWFATAIAAAVALAGNIVRGLAAVVAEAHGRQLADGGAERLQERARRLDLCDFDRAPFHDLLHRAGGEASQRPVRLLQDLVGLATALVSLCLMGIVLGLTQPWLPVLVAFAAVPISLAQRRHARLRFRWHQEHIAEQRDVGYLGSVLTGRATAKDVRMHRAGSFFATRMAALRERLRGSLLRLALRRARDELLVHTLAGLALFAAYLYLGHLTILGVLSVGGLVLHAQAVQRTQNAVRDVLGAAVAIGEDRLFLAPLAAFFGLPMRTVAIAPVVDPTTSAPAIRASAVDFGYPDTAQLALKDLSFTVTAGQSVAIVGRNGSGKSTLLKLLCRLYDPACGTLTADGQDLRQFEPAVWRDRIAVLFQEANVFELSLRENLTMGRAIEDPLLWRALEVVALADEVRALPAGLSTPLSRRLPGGIDWSGGNLRRLALARTFAAPATLLVLDEPFAQLDAVAVGRVAAELRARAGRQTILVADHHVAAVRTAERVLVLDHGRLVADGSPAELAIDGHFQRLFPA